MPRNRLKARRSVLTDDATAYNVLLTVTSVKDKRAEFHIKVADQAK